MNYTIKCNALGNKKEFVQTSVVEWSYHCSGGAQLTARCRELTTKFSRKRKAPTITLCQPVHWKVPTTQWKGQAMRGLNGNGLALSTQSIEEMKAEQREQFSLNHINKAELERCSGISRRKLRRFKRNGFRDLTRGTKGRKHAVTKPGGYTGLLDSLLRQGVKNSSIVAENSCVLCRRLVQCDSISARSAAFPLTGLSITRAATSENEQAPYESAQNLLH